MSAEEEVIDSEKDESIDDFDSDLSSLDEDYDSSDIEYDDYNKLTDECIMQTEDVEQQYNITKEILRKMKMFQIDTKLQEILDEKAPEYTQPLDELNENKNIRIQIAECIRKYRIYNVDSHSHAETLATKQNFENEKELLFDTIKQDIESRIRKLNEDRYKADSDFYTDSSYIKRSKRYSTSGGYTGDFAEKRRKPVTVVGPYIVYMLKEEEIKEDVNYINCLLRSHKNKYLFI